MLQTLERTNIFDARVLTAAHADALRALAGPGGLPLLPCLHPALEEGQIVGDYAGQDELQAAAADFGWGKNGLELVLRPV